MTPPTDPMSEALALAERMTPGDWTVERYGDGDSLVIHSGQDWRVCFMATPDGSPGALSKIEANAAGIVAAIRAFRAICAPESVEALARVLCADGRYPLEDWRDYEPEARAVLAHLARIAMEGGER